MNTRQCLICSASLEPFISFGQMPIANGFLTPADYSSEYFFELQAGFCGSCYMVQLIEQPRREKMFHENYAFFSSTSTRMAKHFETLAELVKARYLKASDPLVVELGSNDGILLGHFARSGIRHVGVEPSANVAQVAREKGICTISRFFDEDLAQQIVTDHGQADVILAANVMCHIPYLHSVLDGFGKLLKSDGVIIFEDPYLGDIVEKISYDQIYDEHAFYFSVASLSFLFAKHGFEIVDVRPQSVHGGSMRYFVARTGVHPVDPSVGAQLAKEDQLGLRDSGTYVTLRHNVERSRDELLALLKRLRQEGKRVVGYGATSKSTTVTNYCGLTAELVEFISDTTPIKQGKFSPGVHIPVRPYEEFRAHYPDYGLLFAWNHSGEVMAKELDFRDKGGKWISYVPSVQILE